MRKRGTAFRVVHGGCQGALSAIERLAADHDYVVATGSLRPGVAATSVAIGAPGTNPPAAPKRRDSRAARACGKLGLIITSQRT